MAWAENCEYGGGGDNWIHETKTGPGCLICSYYLTGLTGYLGLMFQIDGETHYGWALLSVSLRTQEGQFQAVATLHGYAYETTPGVPISVPTTTTTALTSSPNPSTYGEAVTFTAVVTPAPPDGQTVSFMMGKKVLGTGALSGGSASFTTSTLKVGTTLVTAVYGGDSNLSPSVSMPLKQVVEMAD